MELRHLRYFVAVAEELHFRRAAQRLHVAQPAISEQIRKLETELGVRLFDRTPRSVRLTPAGTVMLEEARRVLAQAEAAQLAVRSADGDARSPLLVGYVPDMLPAIVPRTLRYLVSAAPAVQPRLTTGDAGRLVEEVRAGRLDAAIVGAPAATSGLRATSLGAEPLHAALPASDPRVREPVLRLAQLAPERIVVPPREANPALHAAVTALAHDAGIAPQLVEAAEARVELALLMVAAGAGTALLPACAAEGCSVPGVRTIPLAGAERAYASVVVSHPASERLGTHAFLRALSHVAARAERAAERPALVAA